MTEPEIITTRDGRLGRITLNRPAAINALSFAMIEGLDRALSDWEADQDIDRVLIEGAGTRGLCAGGDIRAMHDAGKAGHPERTDRYLAAEYALNARIAAYPKPYLALMDGIVMGGGIGVSAHGAIRIVTERSRLAMPEVGIGFIPDVGGSWLLSRAPDQLGTHAALTGNPLSAFDAIACGLADHHVPSQRLPALVAALRQAEDPAAIVAGFATAPEQVGFSVDAGWIADCYRFDSATGIVAALARHADPRAREAAARIASVCPTSVVVALRAQRRAQALGSLKACLAMELELARHMTRRPDFVEGVRAAVIDKDRNPSWQPARLDAVDAAECDAMFEGV